MITPYVSMVATDFKIADPEARCSITKGLYINDETSGGLQSRNLCFTLQEKISKETKQSFLNFYGMFDFFDSFADEATNPFLACKPFNLYTDCDMAATWRGSAKGGGTKLK
jgi:hypothetical protein